MPTPAQFKATGICRNIVVEAPEEGLEMGMRNLFAVLLAAGLLSAGQAGAASLLSDTSICDKVQKQYREGNNTIDMYNGAPDLDPQLGLLRHVYINTLMTRQLIALSVIQWYNCNLPASPLPPFPILDVDTFLEAAAAVAGAEEIAVLSEGRLKRNRVRILSRLRDVAAINALPAACAGSAAFAASDIQELFDALYQIGATRPTCIISRPSTKTPSMPSSRHRAFRSDRPDSIPSATAT
jgi:hypothetical protein